MAKIIGYCFLCKKPIYANITGGIDGDILFYALWPSGGLVHKNHTGIEKEYNRLIEKASKELDKN